MNRNEQARDNESYERGKAAGRAERDAEVARLKALLTECLHMKKFENGPYR